MASDGGGAAVVPLDPPGTSVAPRTTRSPGADPQPVEYPKNLLVAALHPLVGSAEFEVRGTPPLAVEPLDPSLESAHQLFVDLRPRERLQ